MAERLLRGTPIYVTGGSQRIALVPEIRLSRRRLRTERSAAILTEVSPSALYVIDRSGVKRVAVQSPVGRQLQALALLFLVGPSLNLLTRRRKKRG